MIQVSKHRSAKSKFNTLDLNTKLGVAIIATKQLFDVVLTNQQNSELTVNVSVEDSKIPYRTTSMDAAYKVIGRFKSEGYTLFVDDTKKPETYLDGKDASCVVAKSTQVAIKAIEKLGCPKQIFLDYNLVYPETIEGFLDWFVEKYRKVPQEVPENFQHHPISVEADFNIKINRKMHELYDVIWN